MANVIAGLLLLIGIGILVFWLLFWQRGGLTGGLSTVDSGNYIAFHIGAEIIAAALAVTAGSVILFHGFPDARPWVLFAAGALLYTGINSLGWSTRNDNRLSVIFVITVAIALWAAWYAEFGWQPPYL